MSDRLDPREFPYRADLAADWLDGKVEAERFVAGEDFAVARGLVSVREAPNAAARQSTELLHGERYSQSWSESLPDFVKLAEAFGAKGILCSDPADLDEAIMEMLAYDGPVIFDCLVEKHENCFPMIPSGKAHNEMLLGDAAIKGAIDASGSVLV